MNTAKPELNLIAPINRLGYGQASYYLLRSLQNRFRVHLTPIGKPEQNDNFIKEALETPHFKSAPCIRIWHQHSLKEFIGKGKHIGFPIFELDTFTDVERHHLNNVDELFVCSKWARNVIEHNDIPTPVTTIPLGVDTDIFNPARSNPVKGRTIFFNCGKWEVRKGHQELAQAWHKAFKPGDPVELWLMCDNPFYPPELSAKFRQMFILGHMGAQVRFIDRVESHLQVAKLMGAAHVGVFPSKAEGWNLEALEMMAMGKHVILTNYAGHTEFANRDNSYLINVQEKEPAKDGIWFHGQGNWVKLTDHNIGCLVDYMKGLHEENMTNGLNINHAAANTGQQFSWDNSAEKIYNSLC